MQSSTTSLVFAALRSFSTRAQRQRPLPHSKAVIRQRVPSLTSAWASHDGPSQPRLAAKYLRHAERVAWELGVVEELRQFEEAAAAFPNPPKLVAATCVRARPARALPNLVRCPQAHAYTHTHTTPSRGAAFLSAAT